MFPSLDTNVYDHFDPFITHQANMLPSFTTHIQSPISHHDHHLHSLPFPENFLDKSFLISQILLQHQDATQNIVESPRKVCNKIEQKKKNEKWVDGTTSEKRRTEKKRDSHSKICTAQGPRDRRMRLSLQIARRFFGLQDMLGFDKPSKTVEWLISKSKASIKRVKESVAASGEGGDYEHLKVNEKAKDETLEVSRRRTKTMESSCEKESREKARKRARDRTMKKMKMKMGLTGLIETTKKFSDLHQETRKINITSGAQVDGENQEQEMSTNIVNMAEYQMDSMSMIENFVGLISESSSSSTSLSSIRGTTSSTEMLTSRENTTSIASVDEERNPISNFSLCDYLCY